MAEVERDPPQFASLSRQEGGQLAPLLSATALTSIIEGQATNEGRSDPSPSVTVVPAPLSFPFISIPRGTFLIVWRAAGSAARGGHVNVISMQQMTALRETMNFRYCPSG